MDLARAANLKEKIDAMYAGDHINSTEDRAVLHVATRARREQVRSSRGSSTCLCRNALACPAAHPDNCGVLLYYCSVLFLLGCHFIIIPGAAAQLQGLAADWLAGWSEVECMMLSLNQAMCVLQSSDV